MIITHFLYDVLDKLNYFSKRMQNHASLLIEFSELNEKMLDVFNIYKNTNGQKLKSLISETKCGNDVNEQPTQPCTIDTYYEAPKVVYKNFELTKDFRRNVPFLYNIREPFLNKLIEELRSYFPDGSLNDFKIFLPNKIPTNEGMSKEYGVDEIKSFNKFFEWNIETE